MRLTAFALVYTFYYLILEMSSLKQTTQHEGPAQAFIGFGAEYALIDLLHEKEGLTVYSVNCDHC